MDETNEVCIREFRTKAMELIETMSKDEVYEKDVERIKNDDKWVLRFIQHKEYNLVQAIEMVEEALKWRKEFGVYSITEDMFPKELFKAGGLYAANHDKEGHQVLLFNIKLHRKDACFADIFRKFIVYWVEKMEKDNDGEMITVVFDMTDAGLGQLDLEMVKFLTNLFKCYYPNLLAYLLVFELPWILTAAWKIVKSWLSPRAQAKIRFINKSSINDYIADEEVLPQMGGSSTFKYSYVSNDDSDSASSDSEPSGNTTIARKKVHFASDFDKPDLSAGDFRKIDNNHKNSSIDPYFNGRFLRISPAEELIFFTENQADSCATLYLMNNTEHSIAFKVKTTTPEKFRVRPSSGTIKSKCQAIVVVQLQFAYQNSTLTRDKFLIMAMEIDTDDIGNEQLSEQWKKCSRDNMMEHKLRCSLASPKNAKFNHNHNEVEISPPCNNPSCSLSVQESQRLQMKIENMHYEMRLFAVIMIVLFMTLLFFLFTSTCSQTGRIEMEDQVCSALCKPQKADMLNR